MAATRNQTEPLVPPAMEHTVPLPPKPKPAAKDASEEADNPASVAVEPVQGHAKPLEAVDREIADEADRLMDSGVALTGDVQQGEHVPPGSAEPVEDLVIPATIEATSPNNAAQVKGEQSAEQMEESLAAAASEIEPPQPEPEPEPRQPKDDAPSPADEPEQHAAREPAGPSWLTSALRAAVTAVMAVLLVLNHPMRLAPESARSFVNWFAISLLLWVPAIWFIALFVI